MHAINYASYDALCTPALVWLIMFEVYAVPHSSPEVSAQFPILCMYLMGSNWSSAYRSASRGKLLLLLLCIVRLQLGSRWVRVRVSCRVRFSVRVSFTVRVCVMVIQVAILSCKLWGNSTTSYNVQPSGEYFHDLLIMLSITVALWHLWRDR